MAHPKVSLLRSIPACAQLSCSLRTILCTTIYSLLHHSYLLVRLAVCYTGYFADLQGAGFEAANIGLLDPRADGARDATLTMLKAAVEAREKLVVCCADGHKLTSVVLADWLLTDYIGGENYDEACHALAMRKRLAGVQRNAAPEDLERWMTTGKL